MTGQNEQDQRFTQRVENAQGNHVQQFENQLEALRGSLTQADLEALRAQTDPAIALDRLSGKVDAIPDFNVEAGDLSSAEILVALREHFQDYPELVPLLVQKLGIELKYDDPEVPENKPFIDWALENGVNPILLGALMDMPANGETGTESVLKKAISKVSKPEPLVLEDYHRAVLFQALELYVEVPRVKEFIEESRFINWPFHRTAEQRESLDSLEAPKLELLTSIVQLIERAGYFEDTGIPEQDEANQQRILLQLQDEFRERYDERADLNIQATLIFYEYPELATDPKYLNADRTINGTSVRTFFGGKWDEIDVAPVERGALAQTGTDALAGLKGMFGAIGGFFDSKDYTQSKPPIEKLASALELGDILSQGMNLATLNPSSKAELRRRFDERVELYVTNLEQSGQTIDEIIPPEQQRDRTVEELTPEEVEEIEALFATVGPEWEGTKAQRLYEETVLRSFCEAGMPCKKTFEEFIQEDYQISTIRRFFVECSWVKGLLGFFDEKMGKFVDFLTEKGIVNESGPTPREQLQEVKEKFYKGALIEKVLEDPTRFDSVQIKDVAFTQAGLQGVSYEQLYALENTVLGEQNEVTTHLRQQNLKLANLLYLVQKGVVLSGDRVAIDYGESYGTIQIPLDGSADAMIEKLRKYEEEDTEELIEEIAEYNFLNDTSNAELLETANLPMTLSGIVSERLVVLNEEERPPVYEFHSEFREVLDQPEIWTDVTEGQLKKLAQALTKNGTKLQFASVAADKVVVEEESKALFTDEEVLEFTSIVELAGALK